MNAIMTHSRTQSSWLAVLLLVPLLVLAGCDSNDSDMGDSDTTQAPQLSVSSNANQFTVSFDASGTSDPDGGSIQSYDWDFGDGETETGEQVEHTYGASGDYTVSLSTVDDDGESADTSFTVAVDPNQIVVTDDIDENTMWSSDKTYILDGLVFVNPDVTLTIEPGTVVKARPQSEISNEDGASALIVRRDGTINADGAADNPIVFTSTQDDLEDDSDLTETDRGLWGGIILLGNAPISEPQDVQIEGIPDSENALFGGDDPADNSGTLRYVSIRHGGFSISGVSGDEINGLTMGAIGSGTTIEYVEVFANLDDGFEWFGGTVHTNNLVAAYCGDDSFDWDTGFRGTGQFWFAVQGTDAAGRGGELDGYDLTTDENGDEFSDAVVSNATFVGSGVGASPDGGNDYALRIRNGGASEWYNSIYTAYPDLGVRIDADDSSDDRWAAGDITLRTNVFFDFGAGSDIPSIVERQTRDTQLQQDNEHQDPQLAGIDRGRNSALDPRPNAGDLPSPEAKSNFENTSADGSGDYPGVDLSPIQDVNYLGAFDPSGNLWTTGWTKLSTEGYTTQ
jgi:hypothetical protein